MDLGDQIRLDGFLEREPGELLIAKKLIGNHVKGIATRAPGFRHLDLRLEYGDDIAVYGSVDIDGTRHAATARHANVFFALDRCLKGLAR
jgi:hypothetical protein